MITVVEWLIDQLEKKGDASVNMSIGRMQISIIEEDYIKILRHYKYPSNNEISRIYPVCSYNDSSILLYIWFLLKFARYKVLNLTKKKI